MDNKRIAELRELATVSFIDRRVRDDLDAYVMDSNDAINELIDEVGRLQAQAEIDKDIAQLTSKALLKTGLLCQRQAAQLARAREWVGHNCDAADWADKQRDYVYEASKAHARMMDDYDAAVKGEKNG